MCFYHITAHGKFVCVYKMRAFLETRDQLFSPLSPGGCKSTVPTLQQQEPHHCLVVDEYEYTFTSHSGGVPSVLLAWGGWVLLLDTAPSTLTGEGVSQSWSKFNTRATPWKP